MSRWGLWVGCAAMLVALLAGGFGTVEAQKDRARFGEALGAKIMRALPQPQKGIQALKSVGPAVQAVTRPIGQEKPALNEQLKGEKK